MREYNTFSQKLIFSDLKYFAIITEATVQGWNMREIPPSRQEWQPLYGPILFKRAPRTYKGASRVETFPNNYQAMEAIAESMTQRYRIFKRLSRA